MHLTHSNRQYSPPPVDPPRDLDDVTTVRTGHWSHTLQPQTSHEVGLDRFRVFLDSAWTRGSRSLLADQEEDIFYIPFEPLRVFLATNSNVDDILGELYPAGQRPAGLLAEQIIRKTPRIFAILLFIGQGHLIHYFVQDADFWDPKLPFAADRPPPDFPTVSGNDSRVFEKFCSRQLAFSVPDLEYDTIIRYKANRILPFERKARLGVGQGHSCIVHKIEVHPDHDKLDDRRKRNQTQSDDLLYVYVLKTFKTKNAEADWEQELGAFLSVKQDARTENNLVAFFGSFRHGPWYTLILEYADLGTLEDLLKDHKPAQAADVFDFWTSLLDLPKALRSLHGDHTLRHAFKRNVLPNNTICQGVHQDVKPQNILVFSRVSAPYGCVFKLADLGSSHFKPSRQALSDEDSLSIVGRAQRATRTYGAPELYMHDPGMMTTLVEEPSKADVWSLGAIFSETLTWTILGWPGLRKYRKDLEGVTQMMNIVDVGCFHSGSAGEVLPHVLEQHRLISGELSKRDVITEPVIDLVEDMLRRENARLTALQVCARTVTTLEKAKRQAGGSAIPPASGLDDDHDSEVHTPMKQSPRSRFSKQSAGHEIEERLHVSHMRSRESGEDVLGGSPRKSLPGSPPNSSSKPRSPSKGDRSSTTPLHYPGYNQWSAPPTRSESLSTTVDPSQLFGPVMASRRPRAQYEVPSHTRDARQNMLYLNQSLQEEPEAVSGMASYDGTSELGPRASYADTNPIPPVGTIPAHFRSDTSQLHDNIQARDQEVTGSRLVLPDWSVQKASAWRERRRKERSKSWTFQSKRKREPIPDEEQLEHLHGRDCVFLIDTAGTMGSQWADLESLLSTWSYILKFADPDGMDVYLTQNRDSNRGPAEKRNFKDSTSLIDYVRSHRPNSQSRSVADVGKSLSNLLDGYRAAMRSNRTARKMIIYVLTDGRWLQRKSAETAIKNVTEHLNQHRWPEDQLGIQMIQFGNDSKGSELLAFYDDDISSARDIVDREHAWGNMWKILLGSINAEYDQTPSTMSHQRIVSDSSIVSV